MKTRYKHVYFEQEEWFGEGKRPTYICKNNKTNSYLATIFFYSTWQKYVFESEEGTVFDTGCLRDIIHFMEQLAQKGDNNVSD